MNHKATHQITDALGTDKIAAHFGVSERTVRLARTTGEFAASWYKDLAILTKDAGIECPMDAFNWKSPDHAPCSEAS